MASDPLIGRQLGDYKIEGLIGHGGMARIYRGYDEKLDRFAAIKVIEPTLIASGEDGEYRDRFLREARSIARLNHPNIASIYQFAQQDNLYFIAMEYLNGRDLREILKENAEEHTLIPRDKMLDILHDIASSLDYAHKHDIIHRDIKPSNIIITTEGKAVLTDFGLALNAVEGTIGNTFGSVHYIAPEQAISSAQAVPQSDQYSLGVIVYEMLTGQVPFDDRSAMSVALKHISDPPPPIRDLNPKVSSQLEAVVMQALDKEPNNRYPTVSEFVKELEKAMNNSSYGVIPSRKITNPPQQSTVIPSSGPSIQKPPTPIAQSIKPIKKRRIFISYRKTDASIVHPISQIIENWDNVESVWIDRQLKGGQHWWKTILHEIFEADLIITALSNEYLDSVPCQREFRYARDLGKAMLPIKVNNNLDYNRVTAELVVLQTIDLVNNTRLNSNELYNAINEQGDSLPLPKPLPTPPPIPMSILMQIEGLATQDKITEIDEMRIFDQLDDVIFGDNENEKQSAIRIIHNLLKRSDISVKFYKKLQRLQKNR